MVEVISQCTELFYSQTITYIWVSFLYAHNQVTVEWHAVVKL